MTIEIGTKLKGVWGAMISDSEGEVVAIKGNGVEIAWDGDFENLDYTTIGNIHEKGYRSVNGSPIGIFKR